MSIQVMWFRQDLRLNDNPALAAAATAGNVVAIYILDDVTPRQWKIGGAQRWWLHHSLVSLTASLRAMNVPLILRKGSAELVLPEVINSLKATHVYWNRCYEPYTMQRDAAIQGQCAEAGVSVETCNSSLLFEPWNIHNLQGGFYKVFTPFWKACCKEPEPQIPLAVPRFTHQRTVEPPYSEDLDSWHLLPLKPNWADEFGAHWKPGEGAANERLHQFLSRGIEDYAKARDVPDCDGTSQLSPYLHFGEISPRTIWHAAQRHGPVAYKFLSEIGWREFSYHLLYHFPQLAEHPFKSAFAHFPWLDNPAHLKAWQKGLTGYPIVDAGMRQLWHTGWMHNRVRMIVASFLTKDLRLSWQLGAQWFWDTLVDADLASNSASWQWVAGCGADAAPYYRIFNPVTQGEKFDPDGHYIRRWIPELAHLPNKYIHRPWESGIDLGNTYPKPIVDHAQARIDALEALKSILNGESGARSQ